MKGKGKQNEMDNLPPTIHGFLSRHIPPQVSTTRKLCYRHRPDLIKKRMPDAFDFNLVQKVNKNTQQKNIRKI
jgi:F-box/WD-40 domain protein MET30